MLPIKFRFIWPSGFRAELFLKIDQSETGITGSGLYRAPSIYASYQVSMHLAKQFQRKMFFFKSTNQKQELPVVAMFVNGSQRNEKYL